MSPLSRTDAEIDRLMDRARAEGETAALLQRWANRQRDAGNHGLAHMYQTMANGQAHGQLCDEMAASALKEGVS